MDGPIGGQGQLTFQRVASALGEWQAREVRIARGFAECKGLGTEQIEDVYQETALALLERTYPSEEHHVAGPYDRSVDQSKAGRPRAQHLSHQPCARPTSLRCSSPPTTPDHALGARSLHK